MTKWNPGGLNFSMTASYRPAPCQVQKSKSQRVLAQTLTGNTRGEQSDAKTSKTPGAHYPPRTRKTQHGQLQTSKGRSPAAKMSLKTRSSPDAYRLPQSRQSLILQNSSMTTMTQAEENQVPRGRNLGERILTQPCWNLTVPKHVETAMSRRLIDQELTV